jgi:hypothetical protein
MCVLPLFYMYNPAFIKSHNISNIDQVLVKVGPSALINAFGHCDLVRSFVTTNIDQVKREIIPISKLS